MAEQVIQEGDQANKDGELKPGDQTPEQKAASLGWRAALPDDQKEHELVKGHQKPGDFVKWAIETKTNHDVLTKKLESTIPKLADDSTDEEKEVFWHSLGMPENPEDYELPDPADGKKDAILDEWARKTFHKAHLNKEQATLMGAEWNRFTVSYNAAIAKQEQDELANEMKTMKTDLGDKYDANVEMGKRFFKKVMEADFNEKTPVNTVTLLRFVIKAGKLMGEDTSPSRSGGGRKGEKPGLTYGNSPKD